MNSPKRIIIRTPNWMGDLLISTGFLSAVLKFFPNSDVDLIVKKGFEALPLPHRGAIYAYDKSSDTSGRLPRTLKAKKYDRTYLLPPSFSSAWMAFRAGIPERIGYGHDWRSLLLSPSKRYRMPHRSRHLLQEYLDLLGGGLKAADFPPDIKLDEPWVAKNWPSALKFDKVPFILIAPGATYGPAKWWPIPHYQRLVQLLHGRGFTLYIVGTRQEKEAGDTIIKGGEGRNLCGATSLANLFSLVARARLIISNDSGIMHAAAALKKPQIAIFGSTSPVWTGPINPKAVVLYKGIFCTPCFKKTCRYGHYDCLQSITPEEVFEEVEKILKA